MFQYVSEFSESIKRYKIILFSNGWNLVGIIIKQKTLKHSK